jgi:glycerol-3-phosphate dehydrogenase (NAD(P)+)
VTTIATRNLKFFDDLGRILGRDFLKIVYFDDLLAVQLCGLVKNVLAVLCGIVEGLEMGRNTFAFLTMKGIGEITNLCRVLGCNGDVILTPAGIGDLVLTCTSHSSRNMSFGYRVGCGEKIEKILENPGTTVEGLSNAKNLYSMSKKFGLKGTLAELLLKIIDGSFDREELSKTIVEGLLQK